MTVHRFLSHEREGHILRFQSRISLDGSALLFRWLPQKKIIQGNSSQRTDHSLF